MAYLRDLVKHSLGRICNCDEWTPDELAYGSWLFLCACQISCHVKIDKFCIRVFGKQDLENEDIRPQDHET